jgi:tryptophanyl-tRNA synthetase
MQPRLFSGMQPTGDFHIGNYLGAVENWARLQEDHDAIYCVVDLHALTVEHPAEEMAERTLALATMILAAGVDPEKATLFVQSQVPEHSELCWVLNTVTPMGELHRMTQFKEKSDQHQRNINVGLFGYPVLQAADILLYKAAVVPVGEDQVQHIELSRDIARRFNNRFGFTFPEPGAKLTEARRIIGTDGARKMSKSLGNHLGVEETADERWKKLAQAVTDPARVRRDDPGEPTKCNVYAWHGFFSSDETLGWVEEGCRTAGIGCFDCKKRLAEHMEETLGPIRERAAELKANPGRVREILAAGAERCRGIAQETMAEVRERLGVLTA